MAMNEADTRANLIDPKLRSAGWGLVENSYIRREVTITNGRIIGGGRRASKLSSDYVLEYKGRKLAAVEAKKASLSYTEGVRQAKEYARRLQCPVGYATNGREIYQIDMVTGKEGLVEHFLSPDELWQLAFNPNNGAAEPDFTPLWRERFAHIPFQCKGDWRPRYYQENAINAALEAIASGEQRILLTLATGTGKTCIAFQIAWKLFHGRWSLSAQKHPSVAQKRPRILFLADRNLLANQAVNDFAAFGEDAIARIEPSEIRRAGAVPKNASVFFTLFQTFMTATDKDGKSAPCFGDYPQDFFDFVIIDECHRGGAQDESAWRDILNYFSPAVQLGLTATPKRKDNTDTYGYFGEPVYRYTLKEGINDGFLTPFKVLSIVGTMDEYVYTPGDGIVVSGEPEPGRLYKEGDFNRIISIPERERRRVRYWMDRICPQQKTLVFCVTQEHAGLVRDYINQYAVQQGWTTNPGYCVRITAKDGAAGDNDLNVFQDNEKRIPTIVTTSRKLSTGVDVRDLRNIVLMRPCNNMIEFKQIIGRGTRIYEGKDYFTLYDFVKAHDNFADPEWDGEPDIEQPPDVVYPSPDNPPDGEDDAGTFGDPQPEPAPEKIRIILNDGKARSIQHIASALYWSPEGKPITAKAFIERMFDDLPRFFENEDELRRIWSAPDTREKLLAELAQAGYDQEKLDHMKALIDARDSDVYDVLAFVAYAAETSTRRERVVSAKPEIARAYGNFKQREFIDFVLEKYIEDGVEELAIGKIPGLLALKYNTVNEGTQQFGSPALIRETFVGFQKYLYRS